MVFKKLVSTNAVAQYIQVHRQFFFSRSSMPEVEIDTAIFPMAGISALGDQYGINPEVCLHPVSTVVPITGPVEVRAIDYQAYCCPGRNKIVKAGSKVMGCLFIADIGRLLQHGGNGLTILLEITSECIDLCKIQVVVEAIV